MSSELIAAELNAVINGALETGASTYSPTIDVLAIPDVKEAEIVAQGEFEEITVGDVHRRPDGRTVRLIFGYQQTVRRETTDILVEATDLTGDDFLRMLTALADLDRDALFHLARRAVDMTTDERIDLVDRLIEMEDLA